jgi:hypothetical protein
VKIALVIPSIQRLDCLVGFKPELLRYQARVIVVDEGNEVLREYNSKILGDLDFDFFGPEERADRLGPDVDVIPTRCHAETSFGFWMAYEEGAEVVVELDDDCWGNRLLSDHLANLGPSKSIRQYISKSGWYNPLWIMNYETNVYPRGYPYDPDTRVVGGVGTYSSESCVLNMGLWSGQPDLDAATILSFGGLRGLAGQDPLEQLLERKTIVGKDIFFPICSMNTSFRAEIIPAFYQMYMNYEGLDRYCDIWSGLFIKKICDHLGKNISLGQPVVEHRKTERSTFKDLRAEHEGMAINEQLWKVVRDMQLEGKTYKDTYDWLIQCLYDDLGKFTDKLHYKMMAKQVEMMAKWSELYE